MGVIGINPSRPEPQKREKQDPFDRDLGRVLKGLQVAGAGMKLMNEITPDEEKRLKIANVTKKNEVENQRLLNLKEDEKRKKYENSQQEIRRKEEKAKFDIVVANEKRDIANVAFTKAKDLSKRWEKGTITQKSIKISNSWKAMQDLAGQNTGGGDDAFIFLYNKMLDDTSAVMPGEVARVSETGSIISKTKATLANWISGTKLEPHVKAEFIEAGRVLAGLQNAQQQKWNTDILKIAKKYDLDADEVVLGSIVDFGDIGQAQAPVDPVNEAQVQELMKKWNYDSRDKAVNHWRSLQRMHRAQTQPEETPQPQPQPQPNSAAQFDVGVQP